MINEFSININTVELNINVLSEDPVEVVTSTSVSPVINVDVIDTGPPGKKGDKGEKGDPFKFEDFTPEQLRDLSMDVNYVHDQIMSSNQWVVSHNLGKYPSVSVVDTAGSTVVGEVYYVSINELIITFNAKFSGKVFLN